MDMPEGCSLERGFAVPSIMKFGDYYLKHSKSLRNAYQFVDPRMRTAVQAGGHLGAYPRELATKFDRVVTFEPNWKAQKALRWNCRGYNIEVHDGALSDVSNSTTRAMNNQETVLAPTFTIDELMLVDLDMLCLDIEGNERRALEGATETFMTNNPVVVMEDGGQPRTPKNWRDEYQRACNWLTERGYKQVTDTRCGHDLIWIRKRK